MTVVDCEKIDQTAPELAMPVMIDALDRMLPNTFQKLEGTTFAEIAKNPAGIHDN